MVLSCAVRRLRHRLFEDRAVVIGRELDNTGALETGRLDRRCHVLRLRPHLGAWPARLAEHDGLLARPAMPVDDGESTARSQDRRDRTGKPSLFGNTMEGV